MSLLLAQVAERSYFSADQLPARLGAAMSVGLDDTGSHIVWCVRNLLRADQEALIDSEFVDKCR